MGPEKSVWKRIRIYCKTNIQKFEDYLINTDKWQMFYNIDSCDELCMEFRGNYANFKFKVAIIAFHYNWRHVKDKMIRN